MTGRVKWGNPGSRVSRKTTALVRDRGARRIVVTLYPDGIIGLRAERTRREEVIDASWAWYEAVKARVYAAKVAKRKAKKTGGK
jgi:hypothetical protein